MVLGDCSSDPALSGVRGLNSEQKTNNHNLPLSPYSQTTYRKRRSEISVTVSMFFFKLVWNHMRVITVTQFCFWINNFNVPVISPINITNLDKKATQRPYLLLVSMCVSQV